MDNMIVYIDEAAYALKMLTPMLLWPTTGLALKAVSPRWRC